MSSPTKPMAAPLTGPNARRPAKLRIANPDSSDEDISRPGQTARREELFQRARLSQDSQRGSIHGGGGGSSSSGTPGTSSGGGGGSSGGQRPQLQHQSPDDVVSPASAERSQNSLIIAGFGSDSTGANIQHPSYFQTQRPHSLLTTASSNTTPGAERGRTPPSAPAVPAAPPPPPPPPPPPNLTGRDLDTWKSAAFAQPPYTSPTGTLPSAGSSPPLRPLPRPLPQAQPLVHSASQSNASSSSPSTSSLPPISPGSPLSLSMNFTSGSSAPDPSPCGPTPPPKSASWRNAPRPPSPLRTSAPAFPAVHASSPLGLSLSSQGDASAASGSTPHGPRSVGRGSRSSQGDRRSVDGTDVGGWAPAPVPSHPHQQPYPQHPPIGRVTLLATTDGHKFASADVSGSTSSAAIREKIFTALEIPDDEQPAFHLRRHAMGGGTAQNEAPLDNDSLYLYCAEPGESIKGVLAVMSFEQSHPSVPFMPPPMPTVASSGTSKSGRSDEYSSSSSRYPRRPTSHSETASSISDINVLEESDSSRGAGKANAANVAIYPTSSSETSISTSERDHPAAAPGASSSLKRKPHQRRSSHLFVGGPRRASSPSSGGSRRHERDGSTTSSLASPTSPSIPLKTPDMLGVDQSMHARLGSVTPTRPASVDQPQPPPPPPALQRRPPSMSPEEIQQMGSSESIDEQERILRAIQADRERDKQMVEEVIQRERAEEMAREWERRDREEEAERRRRQIREDEETAMEEQRKEQALYKARLEQQLERERSLRSQTQQQHAPVPVNEFGDWGYSGSRPPPGVVNRSMPISAGRANSVSGYQSHPVAHRGSDSSDYDASSATMFPSSRFATQSALASQLMTPAHQRPPLHINVQSPPAAQPRGPAHDSYASGSQSRASPYPQMTPYAPHSAMYSSASSSRDLANRSRQGSFTPQPQRTTFDTRPPGILSTASQPQQTRNLQQMRSNPNFRGGMPLPGQNRPRPPMPTQQSSGTLARSPDSLYTAGVPPGVPRSTSRPSGNSDQMYAPSMIPSPPLPASLSPPIVQGGFAGHPNPAYAYDRIAPPPINTFSRNPSPNRGSLPLGPNSPHSPVAPELRAVSPRPSTMYDAGVQPVSNPTLPRRPSSHYDPPSAPHDKTSFHAPVIPLARSPNQDFTSNQQSPFPSLQPQLAGPRSALEPREALSRGSAPHAGHGRFATEGASPPALAVNLAPPPPYIPSPETPSSPPVSCQPSPVREAASSAPSSPNLARNSAYGGLFDYMVNETLPAESISPKSTATGDGTEIGYRVAAASDLATAAYDGGGDSDDSDDDDTGTNALFLPQRPVTAPAASIEAAAALPASKPTTSDPERPATAMASATAPDQIDGDDSDGHDAGDSTFTAQMRYLRLDGGGDSFLSDESTLGPSGRLSNRSLPPIDTSAQAPQSSGASLSSAVQDLAHSSRPLSSGSPGVDTPDSTGGGPSDQPASGGNLRRKKTVFEKNEDKQWAFRPPAEQVVRELSKFFPEINLEAEFLESDASPAVTPLPSAAATAGPSASRETKLKNRKSIRRVAEERQRVEQPPSSGTLVPTSQLRPPADVKVTRRRSTRMWGGKVEEVTPSALKGQLTSAAAQDGSEAPLTFKWVKGDLIGKGAYGRVYLGLNATTGEMLAVKQVEVPSTLSDRVDDRQSQVIAALKSEIQLLKDLDHPNVVQYLGFEESEDFISIFLEYVPGGSLGSVFRKYGKLEETEVRWFTRQILDGLEYLHGRGILHRDLKGDNILVDPNNDGVVKITDFGVSKQTLEEATQIGGTLMTGSLYWMAPEVVTNAGRGYNSKIDLWSLGCVVLEMLSGARPWQGLEMMPIILKLGHGERPPMPADLVLSPDAADFVYDKSFAVNPDERFSATEALRHPFVQLEPDWDWSRDSALARKVSTKASSGGAARGRRKKD